MSIITLGEGTQRLEQIAKIQQSDAIKREANRVVPAMQNKFGSDGITSVSVGNDIYFVPNEVLSALKQKLDESAKFVVRPKELSIEVRDQSTVSAIKDALRNSGFHTVQSKNGLLHVGKE